MESRGQHIPSVPMVLPIVACVMTDTVMVHMIIASSSHAFYFRQMLFLMSWPDA